MTRRGIAFGAFLAAIAAVAAQAATPPSPAPQPPAPAPTELPTPAPALHQAIVVTPCRDCSTAIVDSPAAVSVIDGETIATAPDRSMGELLRAVPGVHVVRYSTREYEVTSRQATWNLSNSGLALVDGRPIYLDFMGVIAWDLVPTETSDIEQIEVVRGPASAVWGANALTGVVNIITRSPRAAQGSTLSLGAGSFDREKGSTAGRGAGVLYEGSASLSRALSPTLAARVSAGYFESDPLPRPVGQLPTVAHPLDPSQTVGGGTLPADEAGDGGFRNRGTTQPRADLRIDQELGRGRVSYTAGIAGSEGIFYTGIGPFALEKGSYLAYGRVAYTRRRLSVSAFANLLEARAPNLLAYEEPGRPVRLDVRSQTYDLSAGYSMPAGSLAVFTFGGNARQNVFDVALAPRAPDRTELGAYGQGELFVGRDAALRLIAGLRADKFGNIDHVVPSPRVSLVWKPAAQHAVRLSYNRAFRAPSVVNNSLDQYALSADAVALPGVPDGYRLPVRSVGDPELREESLTSWELGYIGTIGRTTTIGLNAYVDDTRDNIDLVVLPPSASGDHYTAEQPPSNWTASPSVISDLSAQGIYLPRTAARFTNLGPIRRKGIEVFLEHRFPDGVTGYANYCWQPSPRALPSAQPFPAVEIGIAPRNRVNAGVRWVSRRWLGSLDVRYADRAFWTDVMPHAYDGWSPAYTSFDARLGVRWVEGRIVTTLSGTNLTNAEVRQHVYGDIVTRTIRAEARFSF